MPTQLIFDRDAALARVDSDKELLCELVLMLKKDHKNILEKLNHAIKEGNFDIAKQTAHSLKSSLGNIGAMAAFETATITEQTAKTTTDATQLSTLFITLSYEIEKFFEEFDRFRHG